MKLVLKLTSGPLTGQIFPISEGLTIGRQGCDILLNESKVSSIHARVFAAPGGLWRLEDNQSKNGLRDENGTRVAGLELKPGAKFQIGSSAFEVLSATDGDTQAAAALPPPEEVQIEPARKKRKTLWNEALARFLEKNMSRFKDRLKPVKPLEPALALEFVRGAQVNARWILGYGPRQIGRDSIDLPIWEEGAPGICFEILPTPEGLLFHTAHPQTVLLNGQEVDSQVLRMGDTIQINDTLIEVDFRE